MEVSQAWGPYFSNFADLGLSWSFSFFCCLKITFIFFMNRIVLIHESSVHVQCLLSRSCSSPSLGVPFQGFSEFCCWASGDLKCWEKGKCINGYCLVSNTKLFAPFLPCRAESSGDACHLFWADSPSPCFSLSTVHSEWHEFICFSLQLWCTFGIICTT